MADKETKRDASLDALCGLLIIYMILYHAFLWTNTCDDYLYVSLNYVLYCFMAWFYFKSGMFYKRQNLADVVNQNFHKLIIPFGIYLLIGQLVSSCEMYFSGGHASWADNVLIPLHSILLQGSADGNLPLWFLLSLFLVKVVIAIADKYKINKRVIFFASFAVAGSGSILVRHTENFPVWVLGSALGLVFYIAGYELRNIQYKNHLLRWLCILVTIASFVRPSNVDIHKDLVTRGYWIAFVVYSIAMIVLLNNLFRFRFVQFPFLTSIGRNSMTYYCLHWILFTIVAKAFNFTDKGLPDYGELWILVVASSVVLPVLTYWINIVSEMIKSAKSKRI